MGTIVIISGQIRGLQRGRPSNESRSMAACQAAVAQPD